MIVFAEEINKSVYAYNETKSLIFSKPGILHNYSDNFIAVKRLNSPEIIDIYDCKGVKVYSPNEINDATDLLDTIV